MATPPKIGLSARELKDRWTWALKYAPKDPAELVSRMGDVVAQLIVENNAAIEKALAARDADETKGSR